MKLSFKGKSSIVTGASGDIQRTLQQKLDDRASVKDFGAVGDGVTDDTAAINRAIKNLMTVENTGKEKRALYFPGGRYKVASASIKIYPHTVLIGDGPTSTIIETADSTLSNLIEFVDLKGQTQANIGADGGEIPNGIRIQGIQFKTSNDQDIMRIDCTQDLHFDNCKWIGPYTNEPGDANGHGLWDPLNKLRSLFNYAETKPEENNQTQGNITQPKLPSSQFGVKATAFKDHLLIRPYKAL